jgi:uncharacterized protein (DUF1697 family)
MSIYIALLRGVNVGGHGRAPMKDLTSWVADAGATAVKTYLQSGNVVFKADIDSMPDFADAIEERIASALGLDIPVMVRSREEMEKVAAKNPFLKLTTDPKALHVNFLAERPESEAVKGLTAPPGPDQFRVIGREIYLYCPNGVGRTKLNDAFFKKLRVVCTTRNWNTVTNLVELAHQMTET